MILQAFSAIDRKDWKLTQRETSVAYLVVDDEVLEYWMSMLSYVGTHQLKCEASYFKTLYNLI